LSAKPQERSLRGFFFRENIRAITSRGKEGEKLLAISDYRALCADYLRSLGPKQTVENEVVFTKNRPPIS